MFAELQLLSGFHSNEEQLSKSFDLRFALLPLLRIMNRTWNFFEEMSHNKYGKYLVNRKVHEQNVRARNEPMTSDSTLCNKQ